MQKSGTPIYSHSLLLQFLLSKAIQLAETIRASSKQNLTDALIGPPSPPYHDWRGTCAWGMSTGTARKMQLYYALLIDSCLDHPPSAYCQVGQYLQQLLIAITHAPPGKEKLDPYVIQIVAHLLESCKFCGKDAPLFLFLWRKHKELDAIIGSGAVADFFKERFAQPLDAAHHYLSTTYAKKGYTHLLPLIEENFASMQQCHIQS